MVKKGLKQLYSRLKYSGRQKYFCIGKNKTGTTSLKVLFQKLGYKVGNQQEAEMLVFDWAKRDFRKIIDYSTYAGEVFQDIPFSLPETYKILDQQFPDAKFILTERDSPEAWYKSLVNFHTKLWGVDGNLPTKEHLMKATYRYPGFAWDAVRLTRNNLSETDLYNKESLIQDYVTYNNEVKNYFEGQDDKLLVLNLKEKEATSKISEFLGIVPIQEIPWENKGTSGN
ncbi:MAG: sulfotransferase [Cytophagales bacterium]|nr:sulfotransferase [Cytophagales bacterium]